MLPFVNTGIAHREPGVGQIGAGLVEAADGGVREGGPRVVRIAAPVVERLGQRAVRLGYLDLDGFVVVVSQDGPLLPNGVALTGTGVWDPTLRLAGPALGPVDDERALETIGAELIGRGPGLTPEGDDVVAGMAGVLAAAGRHDELPRSSARISAAARPR